MSKSGSLVSSVTAEPPASGWAMRGATCPVDSCTERSGVLLLELEEDCGCS